MLLYSDGQDTSWEKNWEEYPTQTKVVSNADILNLRMAPGEGVCMKLEKLN